MKINEMKAEKEDENTHAFNCPFAMRISLFTVVITVLQQRYHDDISHMGVGVY